VITDICNRIFNHSVFTNWTEQEWADWYDDQERAEIEQEQYCSWLDWQEQVDRD
jgi:hypothetical protein